MNAPRIIVSASVGLFLASLLTGCALQTTAVSTPDLVPSTAISGTVHGGSQPIFGAKVYLLAVNPTGYGGPGITASSSNASVSLLTAAAGSVTPDTIGYYATTNSTTGAFSLSGPGTYSCTLAYTQGASVPTVTLSGSEQVYLYVLGGQAANVSAANTSAGLLVALGPCNAPTTKVVANEMTTAATAYAFAGFATDATHIGSSGSALALTNLNNAFANVANLANVVTGSATPNITTSNGTITTPLATINTVADILASCVDGLSANAHCGTLFQYTASSGATGTLPTDTASSAINLAHNPWPTAAGMNALYGLVPATGAPFQSTLAAQPNDFTLGLQISGGGLNGPGYVAIDAAGNAWAMNEVTNTVSKISSAGVAKSGAGGFTAGGLHRPNGMAIDASGNVWVSNAGGPYSISELTNTGAAVAGSPFTGNGLNVPQYVAIDASGNVWVPNSGYSTLSVFSSTGSPKTFSPYDYGTRVSAPTAVAIDTSGDAWVTSSGNTRVVKIYSDGSGGGVYCTGGGLTTPFTLALDGTGNVWATNINGGNSLSEFSISGSGASITCTSESGTTGFTGGGIKIPLAIAIDPAGNVWTANDGDNSLSAFSSAGVALSPSTGYTGGGFTDPSGVAIDGAGNVWAANSGGATSLTELIGASTPVVTPIVANLISPYGTSTVNRP